MVYKFEIIATPGNFIGKHILDKKLKLSELKRHFSAIFIRE